MTSNIDKVYRINRIKVMVAITIGYGFYYVCRLGLSVVKKPLIDEGMFTATQLGNIGAGIFYGYAFGKFINGFLADHVNVKKFFIVGLVLSICCNVWMGFTSTLWVGILVWSLNGWFQSFGAACCVRTIANWFSQHERGRCYGIWSASHPIGEGITYIGTAAIVSFFGWRSGFWGAAIASGIICIMIYFLMKHDPVSMGLPSIAEWKNDHGDIRVKKETDIFSSQLKLFSMPSIWIVGMASALMYVGRYAVNSWGILFLQEAKGFSLTQAGLLFGANTFLSVLGGLAYGFASDKIFNARRPPVSFLFGLIEIVALIVIFVLPITNYWLLMAAFCLFGFSIGGLMVGIGGLLAIDIAPKKAVAAALGFVGIFSYIGAALQESISGYLIDKNSHMVDGVLVYDFTQPVMFWIAASSLSVILAASLWKVKTRD